MFESFGLSMMFGLFALIPVCVTGAMMVRATRGMKSIFRKSVTVVLLGLAEALVVAVLVSLSSLSLQGVPMVLEMLLRPTFDGQLNLIGVAFFWVPLAVQGTYVVLSRDPRQGTAVMLSAVAVLGGLALFWAGGLATGATPD